MTYCNLGCIFCQNYSISRLGEGHEISFDEFSKVMVELQRQGCHNINLVSPSHYVPQILKALPQAIEMGLSVPLVYNTGGYDSVEILQLLDGVFDIYMPDFKFWHRESARRLVKAKDYPQRAREAIREMHRQVGPLKFGPDGIARRGMLLRHLVMPGQEQEATAIFQWLAGEISPDTYVNIMDQYRPAYQVEDTTRDGTPRYADIQRHPNAGELKRATIAARKAGLWRLVTR